jgi:SWI/SNF-related matrix-associated actin-dependent regulator 1 of chromatin subfamily A
MKITPLKDNEFEVSFRYNKEIVQALRDQPKRRFNPKNKSWKVTVKTHDSRIAFVKLCSKFDWLFDEIVLDEMKELIAKNSIIVEANKNGSAAMSSTFEVEGLKKTLFPFQKAGVEYIARNKRVLVGDEMGLGKTITTIAAVKHLDGFPAIIVVPNTLKRNWEREFNDWIDSSVLILDAADDIDKVLDSAFDVLVCNYNTAVKYQRQLTSYGFSTVVADESHYLKNTKAKRTKAFKAIAKRAETVLELTGTPIVNRPNEIVSQLEILDKMEDVITGGSWKFLMRYCNGNRGRFGWDFSGSSNIEELHEKMRATCYVRRESKDVIDELPELTRSIIELPISNRREYTKAETDLINYLRDFDYKENIIAKWYKDETGGADFDALSRTEKLDVRKQYNEMKASKAESAEHLVQINALKRLVGKGKLEAVKEWVGDFLESGQKLVLFAHHTDVIKDVAEHFSAPYITGEIKADKRQDIIDDFQDNPNTNLIVLNLAVGSVGITLTAASSLAFIEQGWTPGEMSQAEKRIHRIGQKNHSNIYYLLGERTIDKSIFNLIEEKRNVTEAVNKGAVDVIDFRIMSRLIETMKN